MASEIIGEGGKAIAIRADIAEESDVCALFDQLKERFGRLDVLINNAGQGRFGPVQEFSIADFDQVVAVNLRGAFLCCQHATRMMIAQCDGYIINISSVVGFKGYPNQSAYTAAKHGVMGLTKSLAAEVQKYGIRVSMSCPAAWTPTWCVRPPGLGPVSPDAAGRRRPDGHVPAFFVRPSRCRSDLHPPPRQPAVLSG